MEGKKFVAYYRVSTAKQGRSGLGLEAQHASVNQYLLSCNAELVGTFTEIETGKGANALDKRPELRAALAACRNNGAALIIAKLDRLARNVHFISGLIETGIEFVAADLPQANKVMIQMYSVMAEWERDQISARTKAALVAAKARGVKLGTAGPYNLKQNIEARQALANEFAANLSGVISGFMSAGMSQRAITRQLNLLGIKTINGGTWSLQQLQRVLCRIDALPISNMQSNSTSRIHSE